MPATAACGGGDNTGMHHALGVLSANATNEELADIGTALAYRCRARIESKGGKKAELKGGFVILLDLSSCKMAIQQPSFFLTTYLCQKNKIMNCYQIIKAIEEYWEKHNITNPKKLYIGITSDVNRRLFGFHNVDEEHNLWIHCPADNIRTARMVEKYFLDLGMQGGDGGGNDNSTTVYCYEVTKYTRET